MRSETRDEVTALRRLGGNALTVATVLGVPLAYPEGPCPVTVISARWV